MNLQQELNKTGGFKNLEMLAKQVVEGFIAGMHKSPFHGFSAEFAEHKIYNQVKAPSISIGNFMPRQISYSQSVMMRKPICVAI